jgi:membrane peptidoglycan carboxypeptidase
VSENNAAMATSILQRVITEGTGHRAALSDRTAAGKTGTTENFGDAWFVGYTPQLVTAVWVGYPDKLVPMETEFEGGPVAGGTFPALIWKSFMERALKHENEPPESFAPPAYPSVAPLQVVYRNKHWYRDNGNCRDTHQIVYFVGSGPEQLAPCKPNEVDVPDVVGARRRDAEARLLSMPLKAEVIWRPAKPAERLGIVKKQIPARGTLSSWSTVRIVLPKSLNGRIPNVVGLSLERARAKLARHGLRASVQAYAEGRADTVLTQAPRAGLASVRNMTIRLVVARS